jgi:hypothetical protein
MKSKRFSSLGRKSPKEVIESNFHEVEHSYLKAPREELTDVTGEGHTNSVETLGAKLVRFRRQRLGKRDMSLHTHPNYGNIFLALPSPEDLEYFDRERDNSKTEVIAQTDIKTGKVQGYTFLHDKRGNKNYTMMQIHNMKVDLRRETAGLAEIKNSPERYYERLLKIGKEYEFDLRLHPARDYYFDKETGNYEKRKNDLGKIVASFIIGFTFLFFLIRIKLTGAVISNSNVSDYKIGIFISAGILISFLIFILLRKR